MIFLFVFILVVEMVKGYDESWDNSLESLSGKELKVVFPEVFVFFISNTLLYKYIHDIK